MRYVWMIAAVLLALPGAVRAGEDPAARGLAIARRADARDAGFHDYTADMRMVLRNRHGQESVRLIRFRTIEAAGDGDRSMIIFDSPRDVKGTAFLSHTHKQGDDDQWLYLPALKRVKRISSRNKSGSFMGSEFSYEDLASPEVEKFTYRWITDEDCDGGECFVIERYPVDCENSGYSRERVWLDTREYRVFKVEYYDRKNSLLKTFTATDYRQYLGRCWRAGRMLMVNHQNGKSTELLWSDFRFRTGLSDRDFDRNSLKRVR